MFDLCFGKARALVAGIIDIALAKSADAYDMNYLSLYAFYACPLAEEQDKLLELSLLETIGEHFKHIAFDTAMNLASC